MNEKIPDPIPKAGSASDATRGHAERPTRRKSGFPRFPVVTLVLVSASIVAVRWQPELERNLRAWATAALGLIGALLLLIWFLASSRFQPRTRWIGLAVILVCGLALKWTLRLDGTLDGTGLPRWVWRGSVRGTAAAAQTGGTNVAA
ncbi:MAG: hypothetical protein ACKOKG_08285, partial [Verrucomicrobiota bacterium]